MKYPERVVVDTNVLIVANLAADHVSQGCATTAIDFLDFATTDAVVVLDFMGDIFEEYTRYCSYKGQPGIGDRFFLYLHQRQADQRRVQRVDIHSDNQGSYHEVPSALSKFDPSDHKFIATVIADNKESTIVNCADTDWREAAVELSACGIQVKELCLDPDTE